jgi:hypothetical protein
MEERIQELVRLIDVQLSIIPNNMVEEQYKSRTLVNYTQALRGLIEVQKTYKEDIENGKI